MLIPTKKDKAKKRPANMQPTTTGKRPWTALRPPEKVSLWGVLRKPKK